MSSSSVRKQDSRQMRAWILNSSLLKYNIEAHAEAPLQRYAAHTANTFYNCENRILMNPNECRLPYDDVDDDDNSVLASTHKNNVSRLIIKWKREKRNEGEFLLFMHEKTIFARIHWASPAHQVQWENAWYLMSNSNAYDEYVSICFREHRILHLERLHDLFHINMFALISVI